MGEMFEKWNYSPHQLAGVSCEHCHGGDSEAMDKQKAHQDCFFGDESKEMTSPRNINKVCGDCHEDVYEAFQKSNHFKSVKEEALRPHCGNCHYGQEGRIINHSQIGDFCRNCHKMSQKEDQFFMTYGTNNFLHFSERTRKSIAIAEKMLRYQLASKKRTVPEEDLQLAKELVGISQNSFAASTIRWHQFEGKEISRFSKKAYYLAQAAIDLLLPRKKEKER